MTVHKIIKDLLDLSENKRIEIKKYYGSLKKKEAAEKIDDGNTEIPI